MVESAFQPAGDQPTAIAALAHGVKDGLRYQTLEGITGSGKTATIAWLIEQVQRPTLILEPNKSLAAQLASELRDMLPQNRVEFFVSYYDYYQPEAYVPRTDTYIEKDSSVNEEIDRLRHAATSSLLTHRDTVVVASVSAIYGLGSPLAYRDHMLPLEVGDEVRPAMAAASTGGDAVQPQRAGHRARDLSDEGRHPRAPAGLQPRGGADLVLRRT